MLLSCIIHLHVGPLWAPVRVPVLRVQRQGRESERPLGLRDVGLVCRWLVHGLCQHEIDNARSVMKLCTKISHL